MVQGAASKETATLRVLLLDWDMDPCLYMRTNFWNCRGHGPNPSLPQLPLLQATITEKSWNRAEINLLTPDRACSWNLWTYLIKKKKKHNDITECTLNSITPMLRMDLWLPPSLFGLTRWCCVTSSPDLKHIRLKGTGWLI